MLNNEQNIINLPTNLLSDEILKFQQALIVKSAKISAAEPAYNIGVHVIPKMLRTLFVSKNPSPFWAFEGSVGRGTWSRTPWIAIYDDRVTTRASDGFFVALIISEDKESVFLTLMNSSSQHCNFVPFRLSLRQVEPLLDFKLGRIPENELSASGRGTGPSFEAAALLWKKYKFEIHTLKQLEQDLFSLSRHYKSLATSLENKLPKEKPFSKNPFILK